ncbi:lytic transglycosylase domain-containing protein [uncultured Erythrobacter sp.]|uniref:lytic transglycosylase domain-containing protein n=1 Tax=uncultured Erythrobacter sp. TaxID=263913 RepID=UPI002629F6E1|nr:lytic transglycosylase domain-containing protein [uncultured Erythrobacter sp.]
MILARASLHYVTAPLALALALATAPAQADVMELDADGARWVAGGAVMSADIGEAVALSTAGSEADQIDFNAMIIPESIVANTAAHAAGVPARYAAKVAELSHRFDLSPSLLEALVWQESRWRENAVSHAGARGLAQLMPGTAKYLGVNPDDPMQNLEGGARYLREQLDRFDGNLEKALAAYNAGPGRVIRANGVPNIRETRLYVAAIMGRLASHSRPAGR